MRLSQLLVELQKIAARGGDLEVFVMESPAEGDAQFKILGVQEWDGCVAITKEKEAS